MHPYAGLPDSRFWLQSVSNVPLFDIDPVSTDTIDRRRSITRATKVATGGSCFAQNIARHLQKSGYNYYVTEDAPADLAADEALRRNYRVFSARYGNIYTSRQLLQLLERAYGNFRPAESAWARRDGRLIDPFRPRIEPNGYASLAALERCREEHLASVRAMFEGLDVFVFTLGLTEAWVSKRDESVLPLAPGVAGGSFDAERYEFANFGVDDVASDMRRFLARLLDINPRCEVILTVSPVPLVATFADRNVIQSTVYSKSVLRVAAEEITRAFDNVFYFPSYEIIALAGNTSNYFEADLRNVSTIGVEHVMRIFFKHLTDNDAGPEGASAQIPRFRAEFAEQSRVVCDEELLRQGNGAAE